MTETPSRQAALFLHLVLGLQQSGMIALGKLMNPFSGKVEQNLDAARDTIETLAAIEIRTRGNLEGDEARVLQHALTELRMNYVDERKKAAARAEAGTQESSDAVQQAEPGTKESAPSP